MAKLHIAHVASEVAPLAKTGGLAEVMGSLPRAQEQAGHKVDVFLPYYREVRQLLKTPPELVLKSLPVHIAPGVREEVHVHKTVLPGSKVSIMLIENAKAFDRDQLYGTPDGDYADNADRFILFCRAVLQSIKETKGEYDILHCHDWQTALIPAYFKKLYADEAVFARTATVFSIHNLAYQGVFPKDTMRRTGFGWDMFVPEQLEFYGKVNLLKAGVLYAHKIATVSPAYAKEILTADGGFGLEGLLKTRSADLEGILNGIDYATWDPATDPHVGTKFSRKAPAGKAACKAALLEELGLRADDPSQVLLLGAVSRLADQKGFDLLAEAIPKLAKKAVRIAVLGTGDRKIQDLMEDAARRFPTIVSLRVKFDTALAHRIYAGSDAYLMPSKFEPCGLGQMIALRYGSLPIARATGGLLDTIKPVEGKKKSGTGFMFKPATAEGLIKAVDEALDAFGDEALWKKLVTEAMGEDFSWETAVKPYDELYRDALAARRKSG